MLYNLPAGVKNVVLCMKIILDMAQAASEGDNSDFKQ